ncbi:MAG: hypothetical protein ABIT58_09530 [Ferruginibacter sp.]
MKKLLMLIEELESRVLQKDEIDLQTSNVNVGWHIMHVIMATIIIADQLLKSVPGNYKRNFNINRLIIFTINKIPRGTAQAPEAVMPSGKITIERLLKYIEITKQKINDMHGLQPNSHFQHPYLGILSSGLAVRFMVIHIKHHLKIINDILK